MSEQSQGPGWWQASDGKWYPPEQAPAQPPEAPPTQPFPNAGPIPTPTPTPTPGPAPTPPSRSGLGTGPIIAIVVAAVAIIAAIVFFATKDDGNKKNASATKSSSSVSSSSSSRSSSSKSSSSTRSSSASGAPQIVAPDGFSAFSDDKDKFAIAVPDRLRVIDLSSADLDQVIQQLADANPKLAELGPQIKSVFQNGGKLFAIDTTSGGNFNDNVNLIATPGSVDVTSDAVKSQAESQLSAIGATNPTFDVVDTPAGKALTSSYTANVNSADGTPITFSGRQAIVSAGGKLWFLTYSTAADDPATFSAMLDSFDVA